MSKFKTIEINQNSSKSIKSRLIHLQSTTTRWQDLVWWRHYRVIMSETNEQRGATRCKTKSEFNDKRVPMELQQGGGWKAGANQSVAVFLRNVARRRCHIHFCGWRQRVTCPPPSKQPSTWSTRPTIRAVFPVLATVASPSRAICWDSARLFGMAVTWPAANGNAGTVKHVRRPLPAFL